MAEKNQSDIPIRTMKDDLALPGSTPPPPPKPPEPPKGKVSLPKTKEEASVGDKGLKVPPPPKKKRGVFGKILLWFFVLLVLGGIGAGAWWYFFLRTTVPQEDAPVTSNEETASLAEVIPANPTILFRYTVNSAVKRNQVKQMWSAENGDDSLNTILEGNPSALLDDNEITDIAYVVLPGNVRPFVVFPKTATTDQLVAQQSRAQVIPYRGWYILHSINSDQYTDALESGSMATTGQLPPAGNTVAQLIVEPGVLTDLQDSVTNTGDVLPEESMQKFFFQYDGADNALTFVNESPRANTLTDPAVTQLLSLVPGDADTVFVGHNFHEISSFFGIERPSELQLLEQLESSYVFYRRQGEDGIRDIGLIAAVPEELHGQIDFDDPTIESLAQLLIPLLSGSPQVSNLSFTADFYREVPLRFVNINQTATQSIDYTIADDFLFATSSKEGMFELIDTLLGDNQSFDVSSPWQELLSISGDFIIGSKVMVGTFNYAPLSELLPGGQGAQLPFVLVVDPGAAPHIHGAVGLTP